MLIGLAVFGIPALIGLALVGVEARKGRGGRVQEEDGAD